MNDFVYRIGDRVSFDYQGLKGIGVLRKKDGFSSFAMEVESCDEPSFLHSCNGLFDKARGWFVSTNGITGYLGNVDDDNTCTSDISDESLMEVLSCD